MYSSDVYIIYTKEDEDFRDYLLKKLQSDKLSVWNGETTHGQGLIDSKVVVIIMSTTSTKDQHCDDEVSLAYISDTPIFPVTRQSFVDLEPTLSFSMKLIVAKLNWMFFENDEQKAENYPVLLSSIRTAIGMVTGEDEYREGQDVEEETAQAWEDRPNAVVTIREGKDFWDDQFGDATEVAWVGFRDKFLAQYRSQIAEQFTEAKVQWMVNLLYGDVLLLRKVVTKHTYQTFCRQKPNKPRDPDRFYNRLVNYAKGCIAMRGVFNMESTVRLDAIQKLGQFKTQAVLTSLLDLSADQDANTRAVAAIALGKTGIKSRRVSQRMIKLLSDEDRLVREAACISLGHMQVESAVPHIVNVWRMDIISHVRAAAEVALSLINSDRAKQAIQMTKVLSAEMNDLSVE